MNPFQKNKKSALRSEECILEAVRHHETIYFYTYIIHYILYLSSTLTTTYCVFFKEFLPRSLENLNLGCAKTLGILSKHCHSVRHVIMLILTHNCV